MRLLSELTPQEQRQILAQYLRDDPLHEGKNIEGANLYKLLTGLAYEFLREKELINSVYSEFDPNSTTNFISEWEKWVGIPDDCLTTATTLEQRRKNILLKLVGINATTKEQIEALALVLGFSIQVEAAGESPYCVFPLTLPFTLVSASDLPFVINVAIDSSLIGDSFPLTLPFTLSSDSTELLKCFLEKIKPANTVIYYTLY